MTNPTPTPNPVLPSPDCRDGKHTSCAGDGLDEREGLVDCPCPCHPRPAPHPTPEDLEAARAALRSTLAAALYGKPDERTPDELHDAEVIAEQHDPLF